VPLPFLLTDTFSVPGQLTRITCQNWTTLTRMPRSMTLRHVECGRESSLSRSGFKLSGPQQRTSVMRNQLPPHGIGYAPETYVPRQLPQATRYNKIVPTVGTDRYGTGVLNTDTFGAGQTAGGIGGNNYTPSPGPPNTNNLSASASSAEPTWG
jgi:hypothetical protein